MSFLKDIFGFSTKEQSNQQILVQELPKQEVKQEINLTKSKSIIQEIHETFYSEVDLLLETAKKFNSLETDKQSLIDKRNRLVAQGFINSIECKEAEIEIKRLKELERENTEKQKLIEAINYFSVKYPLYKFITKESVKKICAKYNLVYSTVDNYIGTVPEKNLKEIENFKIQDEDCLYIFSAWNNYRRRSEERNLDYELYLRKKCEIEKPEKIEHIRLDGGLYNNEYSSFSLSKAKSIIAAPLKDFDTTKLDLKDFKLTEKVILDPVVMEQVCYKRDVYYLIKTAWGDEASDSLVLNAKMN